MRRVTLSVAVLSIGVACLLAAENKDKKNTQADKGAKATITKVDPKNETVTVKMTDKEGKEHERTFKLTGDVRYFDSTGKVVAIDWFRSGDYVLVVEEEGRLKELHQGPMKATITKVEKDAVTVRMTDKEGKDHEQTLKSAEDAKFFDSTGKSVSINAFHQGDHVLLVERNGKLEELRPDKDWGKTGQKNPSESKEKERK
jgi:hypothetical protein